MIFNVRKSRFLRDTANLSIGTAIAQVLAVVFIPILTSFYSADDFGVLATFTAFSVLCVVAATLKMENAILLEPEDVAARRVLRVVLTICLIFSIALFFLLLFLLPALIRRFELLPRYHSFLFIPVVIFAFGSYQALRTWHVRERNFLLISVALVSATIVNLVVSLLWTNIPAKHIAREGLIAGYVAHTFVNTLVCLLGAKLFKRNEVLFSVSEIATTVKSHLKLIYTMMYSEGVSVLISRLPIVAIGALYGNTILGYYMIAERVVFVPTSLISRAVGDVFRQRAARAWIDTGHFNQLLKKTVLLTVTTGLPLYAVGILTVETIFVFFLGEEWRLAGVYASIMLFASFASFVVTSVDKWDVVTKSFTFISLWQTSRLSLVVVSIAIAYFFDLEIVKFIMLLVCVTLLLQTVHLLTGFKVSRGRQN